MAVHFVHLRFGVSFGYAGSHAVRVDVSENVLEISACTHPDSVDDTRLQFGIAAREARNRSNVSKEYHMNDPKVQTTEFANCGPVCRYRLLIGWMAGSEGADGETGIEEPDDLLTGKRAMNEYQYEIPEELEMYAQKAGAGFAFLDDYTATDSMSRLQKLVNGEWHDVKRHGLSQNQSADRLCLQTKDIVTTRCT